ncbi:MAG: glutamine synthetase family protein [Gammaproteobacteria bacterium]|nr:glutamine synthetase family protein [Gammaproteobacteria bacterium]MDH4253043.1 glutamine synthetase family protein [Gammaproteobacteria bacterium]MDH5308535.1 glutamine synthetase family protein [Gammaproteobacteria bacterium]
MAGAARGKVIPARKFGSGEMKMPEAIFSQTVSGNYIEDKSNIEDRDMLLVPDESTLRPVPWAMEPAASVFFDCYRKGGKPVETSPRRVLQNVLQLYRDSGWTPVVAPEVEFYLIGAHSDANEEVGPPKGRLGRTEWSKQPYSVDAMNDFDPFINDLYAFCDDQGIRIDTLSQEMGPAQFEINFLHGDAIELADQVFLFKRTVREAAIKHRMHATFLARPTSGDPGSALHVHQSIVDANGRNIFADDDGAHSSLFMSYIGGLQKYMPEAQLIFAPYPNSYRRFLSYDSSPVNLEWATDNRTVGLRVPDSSPEARRVENRIAGSDVNPYLAIAATLACGYLGMKEGVEVRPAIEGSAYDLPFSLHRELHAAISAFKSSAAMRQTLGESFVKLYSALKENEYLEFQEIVTPWEREVLMFNV